MLSEVVEWEVRLRPRKEGSMSIVIKVILGCALAALVLSVSFFIVVITIDAIRDWRRQ